jgi:signal transduction histidine kinase
MWWSYWRDVYQIAAEQQRREANAARGATAKKNPAFVASTITAVPAQPQPKQKAAPAPSAAPSPNAAPPMMPYFQRLSADGAQGFGLWDSQNGFTVFSANWEDISGVPANQCAGHTWILALEHAHQYAINDALAKAEKEAISSEHLVRIADEEESEEEGRWLALKILAPHERQPSVMVLARDITGEKSLKKDLEKAKGELELANRGRQAFLSSMSHELRTPLNAIMGFSEMMQNQVFGEVGHPTYNEYVNHIHDSGQQLLNKVNDLLEIASLDAGGMTMKEEPFSLNELLAEVREIFSHEAFTRNITLKLDMPAGVTLHADRRQLICAISHFLSNAIRHSLENSEIQISAKPQGQDGLVIGVRDFGKGMPAEQLKAIREALQKEATYFKVEGNGIGLGLSLAKELASRHGGKVNIDAVRGQGTIVTMYLPAERVIKGLSAKKNHLRMV